MMHLKLFEFIDMWDGGVFFPWFGIGWTFFFHLFLFLVMVLLNLFFFMLLDSPCGDCTLFFLLCV